MIEVTLRNYLLTGLQNVPVVMEQPKNPPGKYVLLQVLDAGRINHIDAVTFNVVVIAGNLYDAAALRDDVKDLMFEAISLDEISHVSIGGERAGTDSANHVYTYELTFNFYYYKEETSNG